ncbi:MAG: aryl-sulfate sulfotransferase [Flavobacteriales bacterium]|nr:aryl-sulfate sulfotransferase [Flavobacteriales bacterium]
MTTNLYFIIFINLVSICLCSAVQSKNESNEIIYQSPVANSILNSPSTNIIITFKNTINTSLITDNTFIIEGESSNYDYDIFYHNDFKTIVLEPKSDFKLDEEITLQINSGLNLDIPISYSFKASPTQLNIKKVLNHDHPVIDSMAISSKTLSENYPTIVSTEFEPTGDGFIFMNGNVMGAPRTLLITDNVGAMIFFKELDNRTFDFKVQKNGLLSYYEEVGEGKFYLLDPYFNKVDSFATGNGYITDFHDLQILPNGNALMIAWDPQVIDMTSVVPEGQPNVTVIGSIIQIIDKTTKSVIFQWRSWDHFNITDTKHADLTSAYQISYVHCNAVELDSDGDILISSRKMDEITKISSVSGDIIWRLGGTNNEFTFPNDSIMFCSQHDIRRINNGNITLFDNTNHTSISPRAIEYKLDEDYKTATIVWEKSNSTVIDANIYGSCQRLENGNTFVNWGQAEKFSTNITETKQDGTIVFELTMNPGEGNNSYRSFRTDWCDSVCFNAMENIVSPDDFLLFNYPNPASYFTLFQFTVAEKSNVNLQIHDSSGKLIRSIINKELERGYYEKELNTRDFSSGLYIYTLTIGNKASSKKLIIE